MDSKATRLSRRNLLAGLAAGGVVAALAVAVKNTNVAQRSGSLIREAFDGRSRTASLATADRAQWQEAVGADFAIGHTSMRLAGIRALPKAGPRPAYVRQNPFVAVFELPVGQVLPGNLVYTVRTARYPAFDMFLTAADARHAGRLLAVFN